MQESKLICSTESQRWSNQSAQLRLLMPPKELTRGGITNLTNSKESMKHYTWVLSWISHHLGCARDTVMKELWISGHAKKTKSWMAVSDLNQDQLWRRLLMLTAKIILLIPYQTRKLSLLIFWKKESWSRKTLIFCKKRKRKKIRMIYCKVTIRKNLKS